MAARNINFQKSLQALHKATLSRPGCQSFIPKRVSEYIRQRHSPQIFENEPSKSQQVKPAEKSDGKSKPKAKKLTVVEADEALRLSMRDIDGGGECSIEMENGKFVGLPRGVKDNMFRLI